MSLLAALLLPAAVAGEVILQNDDFDDGTVSFSVNLGEAECVAATFVPDMDHYPFTILYIDAIVLTTDNYEVGIYEVDEDERPVRKVDSEAAQFSGSTTSWNRVTVSELKLSNDAVRFTEDGKKFAVVICTLEGTGWQSAPVTIPDDFHDYPSRNYIQTDDITGTWEWFSIDELGLSDQLGDWIIRVVIDADGVTGGDGGSGDGGTGDSGSGDGDGGTSSDDTGEPGAFSLSSITPNSSLEGEAVDVVVLGTGFVSGVEARIGGLPLTGQSISNSTTITGRVPTTLPAGVHDVEVVLNGESSLLAAGFSVTGAEVVDDKNCGCVSAPGASPLGAGWLLALGALVSIRRRR